jgi:hypothetical protein
LPDDHCGAQIRVMRTLILSLLLVAVPAFARDGQSDFDFHLGTWKTHVRRLSKGAWVEMDGVTTVRKVWNGKANLVELVADGPSGHFEGLSLRLYNPQTQQWSLNYANVSDGTLSVPTIGQFKDGRGEFYDQEPLGGRAVFIRFVITPVDANTVRFEQAYSEDGGKTWTVNWIATDTRM